jgi:hypothetical protein
MRRAVGCRGAAAARREPLGDVLTDTAEQLRCFAHALLTRFGQFEELVDPVDPGPVLELGLGQGPGR